MALPEDVSTITLRVGHPVNGYTDPTGAVSLLGAKGKLFTVDPLTDKRINVTHVASAQTILPTPVVFTLDEGGKAKATLDPIPHTDNAGLSPVGFAYRIEWDLPSGSRHPSPGNKTFALPTAAGATADFDLLDVAEAVPGVLVPIGVGPQGEVGPVGPQGPPGEDGAGAVESVNGQTGAVVLTFVATAPPPSGDTTGATDTAAINALLAASSYVVLQAGRYWVNDSLKVAKSFGTLTGQGRATEIVVADAFPSNRAVIRLNTPSVDKVTISDLHIHGRRFGGSGIPGPGWRDNQHGIVLDNTGGTGIVNTDTNHRIERVFIREMQGRGIVLLCNSGSTPEQRQTHLVGCELYDCYDNGVHIDGPTDNAIFDCTVGGSSSHGFYFANSANNKVVGSKAFYCGNLDHTVYANFYVNGARNVFSGCESQDASGNGVYFGQPDNMWDGLVDCNTRGANSGTGTAGIFVSSNAARTTIRASMPNYQDKQKRDIILNAPATVVLTSPPLTATHVAFVTGDATALANSFIVLNGVPSGKAAGGGGGSPTVFRQASRGSGDVAVSWTTMQPVDGTGALDIVIPAAVGDVLLISRNAQAGSQAVELDWNVGVLDGAGAVARTVVPGRIGGWTMRSTAFFGATGSVPYVVQAGDVIGGNIKLRVLVQSGGGTRTLLAADPVPFVWWAFNHGPTA